MDSTITPEQVRIFTILVRIGFFCGVAWVLWMLIVKNADVRKSNKAVKTPKLQRVRLVSWVLVFAFMGILVYQATWQLGGFLRPRFLAFMQKHDRRKFNPALQVQRGILFDRNGAPLVENQKKDGMVERRYPLGPAAAHLVGYFDPVFGVNGLEAIADPVLSGLQDISTDDWESVSKKLLTRKKIPQGKNLKLTLDARLQQSIYAQLAAGRYGNSAKPAAGQPYRGAVVVLDVRDGSVLAACSAPSFDPNKLSRTTFSNPQSGSPLFNRALRGLYPPGSVFKVAIGSYYLEKTLLGAGYPLTIDCGSEYRTPDGQGIIRDLSYYSYQARGKEWPGFGVIDLGTAIEQSCNVYFAQVGVTIGKDGFDWLRRLMRFDQSLNLYEGPLDRLESAVSRFPELSLNDSFSMALMGIGQGELMVTPIHMAMVAAAVANNGLLMEPRLTFQQPLKELGRAMSERTAIHMREMMARVVTDGTAEKAFEGFYMTAGGKTGSAQNPLGDSHAWFIGYAPVERPQIAVSVVVENGGYGGSTAAPIARHAMDQAVRLNLVRP
jgi:peptidoglycan glycosyltransferase